MKNQILTPKQETALKIEDYILSCIDGEGYDQDPQTPAEKLTFLFKTFSSEYGDHVPYYGSVQETFKNWCMCLPSSFNIEFMNYKIEELGYQWGYLKPTDSESKHENFVEQYWNRLFMSVLKVAKKYKVDIKQF